MARGRRPAIPPKDMRKHTCSFAVFPSGRASVTEPGVLSCRSPVCLFVCLAFLLISTLLSATWHVYSPDNSDCNVAAVGLSQGIEEDTSIDHLQASRKMAQSKDNPLAFMTRLSPNVLYYDPKTTHSPNDPSLVLLASWMGARNAHIAKYIAQYRRLFPSSRILLITFTWTHVVSYSHKNLRPAAEIIHADAAAAKRDGKENEVRMLIHMFSNGGAGTMKHLLESVREISVDDRESPKELTIPRHIFVSDSAPGYFHWMNAYSAMASNFPVWLRPLVHIWIAVGWLLYVLPGRPTWFESNACACRAPGFLALQTRRLYLYGNKDVAVDPSDIEDDAAAVRKMAEESGRGPVVGLELFEGSSHVSHARTDFERYWSAVESAWEKRDVDSTKV